ncbi:MAG TPA: hypothetical protein VIZ18_06165 [Ktedonobacteraceae bacterium]
MDNTNLPPLPTANQSGPEVCAIVRLYLAVIDDLSEEQAARLYTHIATCAACEEEFRILERATWLVGSAVATAPSPRVDAAMRALMEGREQRQRPAPAPVFVTRRPATRRRLVSLTSALVTAAVVVLALFASLHFSSIFDNAGKQTAFALPANLSWNRYVLYHSETRTGTDGQLYEVDSYDDLGTGDMRVETKMDTQLDVIAVGNNQETMGMDTIHHVAQMGADNWMVDDSMFDLQQLRHDFQTGDATYIGTESFRGQTVYRIRYRDGLVILLNMQYRPVNVLRGAVGPGTGEPIYTSLQLLLPSQVSTSMWNMSIPPGYHMGTLPAQP